MPEIELKPQLMRRVTAHVRPSNFIVPQPGEPITHEFMEPDATTIYYFSAQWCAPCQQYGPVLEQIAREFPDVTFYKLDVDNYSAGSMAMSLGLRSVPVLYMVSDKGQFYLKGTQDGDAVRAWITTNG
jgi:thioredoxin-like negative regulator of GroEL